MTFDSDSIQVQTISDSIYSYLKKMILQGELPPGHRLLVLEIAKHFSVSQAPVREALGRLKHEGLISGKSHKGLVVSDVTHKEIQDISVMREIMEGYAIRETLALLEENDFEHLERTVKRMEDAVNHQDMIQILELDLAFHGFFYERCDNHIVLDTWNRMKTKVMRYMAISNRKLSTIELVEEHMDLIKALRTGDPVVAEKRFVIHMKGYKFFQLP